MEKAMATHSGTLAWKIPWTEEPGRLQSTGSLRVKTRLSNFTFTFHFHALEKEKATHSSVPVWRIPETGEPGGLPSMWSHRVGHDWSDLVAIAAATQDGVIPHLQPDILECEVKWALGGITTNKASGYDGIPVELFQILKDDAVKVLYSICQQIWKTQQWPQDWKRSVFILIPRKTMPKNAQPTTQLHSSHMLVK